MKNIFFAMLLCNTLSAQVGKLNVLSEQKVNDSIARQIIQLTICNDTGTPLCLKVSPEFRASILSRDTIEMRPGSDRGRFIYDVWVTKNDMDKGYNDFPRYPLILYPRASFSTTLSVLHNKYSEIETRDCISFSYLQQPDIDFSDIFKKYEQHLVWDADPRLKYKTHRVCW
jgi:hypothetical protein